MTTLVVQVLETSLEQDIRLSLEERYQIAGFLPYIYMHNAPVGTFTLKIIKDSSTIAQKSFNSNDIKSSLSTTANFAHVFYPVIFDSPVQLEKGDYTVRLEASGYSVGPTFLGWIQQHENLNNILDYTPSEDTENPLALRLKVYGRT